MINITKIIDNNEIIVFVIPDKDYSKWLRKLSRVIGNSQKGICYVSLNKPYTNLVKELALDNKAIKRFLFIDAITETVKKPKPNERVIFVSSPNALTELSIIMVKALETDKVDYMVFDSLSTLLVYEDAATAIKFTHNIIVKLRTTKTKGIFTILKGDITKSLMKDLSMFVDKVVDLSRVSK